MDFCRTLAFGRVLLIVCAPFYLNPKIWDFKRRDRNKYMKLWQFWRSMLICDKNPNKVTADLNVLLSILVWCYSWRDAAFSRGKSTGKMWLVFVEDDVQLEIQQRAFTKRAVIARQIGASWNSQHELNGILVAWLFCRLERERRRSKGVCQRLKLIIGIVSQQSYN